MKNDLPFTMGRRRMAWRATLGGMLGWLLVLATPRVADAHAMLISTEPAAGSAWASAPLHVRLLFSEQMDAALDRVTLVAASGRRTALRVGVDPHDVHALIAPLDTLAPGTYWVLWHVVSADGHVVEGRFAFAVGTALPDTTHVPLAARSGGTASTEVAAIGPVVAGAPIVAAAVRAAAVGCLVALTGLLLLAMWQRSTVPASIITAARWLTIAAAVFSIGHLVLWLADTAPNNQLDALWAQTGLMTYTGLAELSRCVCALLAVWALFLVRRLGLAACCVLAALGASALIGHAAADAPLWNITAKLLHLVAAGMWLGGVLFLILLDRGDASSYVAAVERVSGVALVAVVVVVATGVVQTLIITPSVARLIHSAYGAVIAAKVVGVAVLVGFGAYHRTRGIPQLRRRMTDSRVHRAIGWELGVMVGVVILGGWLAYIPPPMVAPATISAPHSTDEESSQ